MNTIEIGKELKKLVFKRPKGGPGEHVYVLVATKEEVDGGKNEVLNLLKEDIESWENVVRLKLRGESVDAFDKKVKKQIPYVLQEEQFRSLISGQDDGTSSPKPKKAKLETQVTVAKNEPIKPVLENNLGVTDDKKIKDEDNNIVPKQEELDVKPVRSFELAELPNISETIKVEDQDEVGDDDTNGNDVDVILVDQLAAVKESEKKVLVFHIKKQIPYQECKKFFLKNDDFENVIKVYQTRTKDDKFRGVYLLEFKTENSALEFADSDVKINNVLLDLALLSEYKKEKYFHRQIRKSQAFKTNLDFLMNHLQEEKKECKLDNCVIVQVEAEEEDVQEYFCGISGDFIENFEHTVEEVKVVESPRVPQYILVFENSEGATAFKNSPKFHSINGKEAKVSLLTERMKLVRFGAKIKNFIDDKVFAPSENDRRIVVTGVNIAVSSMKLEEMFQSVYPKQKHLLRGMIDNFFLGIYIITFDTKNEAEEALNIDITEEEVLQKSLVMPLNEYFHQREHFLKNKQIPRRKRKPDSGEGNKWASEFTDLEKLHEEHWGPFEEKVIKYQDDPLNSGDNSEEEEGGYNPISMLKKNL